ncbi:hypothetical protein ATJ78_2690 [Paramicrobacterium agarici]|uniref:Uncharacterized protein n=1 Tax=Paramicrobacterium agarici TaxID=630514 RepID=A0A2A9DZF4_9MICO|nr:hypothetical protein ATJ78_2690 [Microbacterium agarici]
MHVAHLDTAQPTLHSSTLHVSTLSAQCHSVKRVQRAKSDGGGADTDNVKEKR